MLDLALPDVKCPRCGTVHSDLTPKQRENRTYLCRACRNARAKKRYWSDPQRHLDDQKKRRPKVMRKHRYGLTDEAWSALVKAQGSACAVCGVVVEDPNKLHVDHDHSCCAGHKSCGKCIRGLLCNNCNVGLGYFNDNPDLLEAAAHYVKSTIITTPNF